MLVKKFLSPSPKKIADKHLLPEETIAWVEERLRTSAKGVFQELKRIDKGRLGIPVYISVYGTEGLSVTGRMKQMGKGATDTLARASALMELVERYSLFKTVKSGKFALGTLAETENAVSPEILLSSVTDPEDDREARELASRLLPHIPFHLATALELPSKQEVKIPFFWFWLLYEFNGSAAGNTYAEASVQAICELIERHTSALSTWHEGPFKAVIPDRISEETASLLRCFENLGVKLYLRDFTFDMPVPTIAALAYDPSTFPHRSEIVYTAGTATHPERALVRALTEVAQLAGDFDTEGKYLESGLPKFATLEEAEVILKEGGQIPLSALPDLSAPDHAEELIRLGEALAERGYRIFLTDLMVPELEIPAVYVVIPGFHFRERLFISPLYQLVRTVALYLPRDKALEILKTIDREIDRYYVASYLGQLLAEEGDLAAAEEAFRKALKLNPPQEDLPAIYCHLAHVELRRGNFPKAEEVAEKGLALAEFAELYNILGTARFKQRRIPEALEAYLRALELNPEGAVDYANVGACLAALGLHEEAERFFESARTLDPDLDIEAYRRAIG